MRMGLALLFLIPVLSLAGIPPLSGFWAKFALVQAGLAAGQYVIVAVSLGVSLLTLFSMTKIWAEVFWKDQPGKETPAQAISLIPYQAGVSMLLPVGVLAAILLAIGLKMACRCGRKPSLMTYAAITPQSSGRCPATAG